jgi:hypothetical protein
VLFSRLVLHDFNLRDLLGLADFRFLLITTGGFVKLGKAEHIMRQQVDGTISVVCR